MDLSDDFIVNCTLQSFICMTINLKCSVDCLGKLITETVLM